MLYLAEVQKPKSGFNISGRSKAELKLLACQRSEQNWSAIPGEELVAAPDEATNYNPGVLVLVDMNANRQIQSQLRDAGKHLVGILQNLSRQIEKYKKEADEIESWRQSLSLQSQQLQLRQEEIYGREEDLEHTRAELDRLTQEAQALEATLGQHEQSRQDLAAQWEQLREKEQHLDRLQQSAGTSLSEQQVDEIRAALQQLGGTSRALDPQRLETTVTEIEGQQELLNSHWQQLQLQQQRTIETQSELDRQQQEIDRSKQQLQTLQTSLEETQTAWEVQQHTLSMQQEYLQRLTTRINIEQDNYQKIYLMSKGGQADIGDVQIDLEQLESMEIGQLETIVATLQTEVDRSVHFVHLEEEELQEKQAAIDELQQAMLVANEFDKLKLEADHADERDGYNMLDHTLDGQRQTMRERQTYLQIHTRVLRHRQGHVPEAADRSQMEWDAILRLLDNQRQQQQSELTQMETEIQNLRHTIDQTKAKIEQQVEAYLQESKQVQTLERQHQLTQQQSIELVAKIALYQELMQPLQDRIDAFKRQLGSLADAAEHQPESQAAMQQIESLLNNLVHGLPMGN
ncbi:pilus motility taxis protein HmpF [Chamaesiphon sp. OTE_75_metabat_556]|uniref:pilus motility taxis protein HmpF n=1 Tax=Chamaesiphon sp. OTE_75_metabat_556 TaxID=2964692 RepID=UPI00286D66F2|nr:pilus motility taxis protein HmpF [Chamaesiphon sp. OTE_75_metabat_556]